MKNSILIRIIYTFNKIAVYKVLVVLKYTIYWYGQSSGVCMDGDHRVHNHAWELITECCYTHNVTSLDEEYHCSLIQLMIF